MEHSPFRSSVVAFGVLLATSTGVAGCYAEATTSGVARAEYAPANVTIYPREYYEGRYVYLVGDRWYYRDGPHWVYYVREPQPLVERRVVLRRVHVHPVRESTVVHEAPPARRHYHVDRREDRREPRRRRVD